MIEKEEMEEHIEDEHSTGKCMFCDMEMKLDYLQDHVIACGSRTENCVYCSRSIRRMDMFAHAELCQQVFGENVSDEKIIKSVVKQINEPFEEKLNKV